MNPRDDDEWSDLDRLLNVPPGAIVLALFAFVALSVIGVVIGMAISWAVR